MYNVITNAKFGEKGASVIVNNEDFGKTVTLLQKEGFKTFVDIFDTYAEAFDFKFKNDIALIRSPVSFDPYLLENVASIGLGEPKKFVEQSLRFGYDLAVKSVFDLIDKAEKAGAIKERGVDTESYTDDNGKPAICKTAVLKIDVDRLQDFNLDEFKQIQNTSDNLQYVLFDINMNYDDRTLTIESFSDALYQKEDVVKMNDSEFSRFNRSCLGGFNFKNVNFFKKMAGDLI